MRIFYSVILLTSLMYSGNIDKLYKETNKEFIKYSGQKDILKKIKDNYKKIKEEDKDSKESLIIEAKLIIKKGILTDFNYKKEDLIRVQEISEKLIKEYPKNIEGYIIGSKYYTYSKINRSFIKARDLLKEALKIDSKNFNAKLSFAKLEKESGNINKSIILAKLLVPEMKTEKDKVKLYNLFAELYKRKGKNAKSLELYSTIAKKEKNSPIALINYSKALRENKEYNKSLRYGEQSLFYLDFAKGKREQSINYYNKAIQIYKNGENRENSEKYFKLGIKMDEKNISNYYGLSSLYLYLGKKNKDIEYIKKAKIELEKSLKIKENKKSRDKLNKLNIKFKGKI